MASRARKNLIEAKSRKRFSMCRLLNTRCRRGDCFSDAGRSGGPAPGGPGGRAGGPGGMAGRAGAPGGTAVNGLFDPTLRAPGNGAVFVGSKGYMATTSRGEGEEAVD